MGFGRGLLTGTGWAGTLGAIALCALALVFAIVAMSATHGDDRRVSLPSVHEGRVALPPPGRDAPSPAPARPSSSGRGGG